MGYSGRVQKQSKKTPEEKTKEKANEKDNLIRVHERNLISQWAKEKLRDKVHSDAQSFEKDRQRLLDHEQAVKFLKREGCKSLLAYDRFGSADLNESQKKELEATKWDTPKHLFRVASDIGNGKFHSTKGLDSKDVHVPGISCVKHNGMGLEKGIHHVSNSLTEERDIVPKLGHRLMWHDRNSDPFLSWTPSMLFVLVLGTARLARGEKSINITSIDTDQADYGQIVKPKYKVERDEDQLIVLSLENGTVKRQGRAKFYFVERLLRVTNARCWSGWPDIEAHMLTYDWYTGEWLSHGIVLSDQGSYRANLHDILKEDLYGCHEQLVTEENEDMRSLYHRCVRARSIAFSIHSEGELLSMEDLQKTNRQAARFMVEDEEGQALDSVVPPLHIFLSILGLKKRIRKDHLFMQWIRDHYTAADIASCGYEKTTKIANNLPEVMETIHLARDACIALEIPEIPSIPVWLADPDFDFNGQWLHEFPKEVKIKASGAGKSKLQEVIEFDEDGMALFVKVHKNGWDVQRKWQEVEVKEVDDADGGDMDEEMAESADAEVEVADLEGRELTGGDEEGQDDEEATASAGIDVEMEEEQTFSRERKGSTVGDGDEDMMGVTEEDMSVEKSEALAASMDGDEANVLAEEEEVSRDEDDLMIAGSGMQKPVGAEMEMEEEMALV